MAALHSRQDSQRRVGSPHEVAVENPGAAFGYKLGKAITKQDCRDYAAMRRKAGKSPSTIKTEMEALRACLRWHYGKDAPIIVAPAPSKPRERYLTKEEARILEDAIDTPHAKLFVKLALATGARMGAILDLTWDRVDFTHNTIDFMPAGRDKTNKRRTVVPMTPKLREALEEASKGSLTDHVIEYGGKPVASVKKAIAAAARRAKVPALPMCSGIRRRCGWPRPTCRCRRSRKSWGIRQRGSRRPLTPVILPGSWRMRWQLWTGSGTKEPTDALGRFEGNGGFLRWAVQDSNL
jgi:integrase